MGACGDLDRFTNGAVAGDRAVVGPVQADDLGTDLMGGDPAAMERSLRDVVLPLPDSTLVLPGHGPATTMAQERRSNPYLQGLR